MTAGDETRRAEPARPPDPPAAVPASGGPGSGWRPRRAAGAAAVVALLVTGLATVVFVAATMPGGPLAPASAPTGSPVVTGRVSGPGYAITLPDEAGFSRFAFGDGEAWFVQDSRNLRGVFVGPLDAGASMPTLDDAVEAARAELSGIPGAGAVTEPLDVVLPIGPARRIEAMIGDSRFVAVVLVNGERAWRVMVVNYPDAVIEAVAASLELSRAVAP